MRWPSGDPDEDFGNVLSYERMDAFIDLFSTGHVTFEPHEGKLSFGQSGIDRAYSDASAAQFQPQGPSDLKLSRFCGAISGSPLVSDVACDLANVNDGGS